MAVYFGKSKAIQKHALPSAGKHKEFWYFCPGFANIFLEAQDLYFFFSS